MLPTMAQITQDGGAELKISQGSTQLIQAALRLPDPSIWS